MSNCTWSLYIWSWSFPSYNSARSSCVLVNYHNSCNWYAIKPFLPLHFSCWYDHTHLSPDGIITTVSCIQFTCVVAYFPSAHNSLCGRRVFSIMIRFGILAIHKLLRYPITLNGFSAFPIEYRGTPTPGITAALQNLNCQKCAATLSLYIGHKISANSDAINGTAPLMRAPQNRTSNICNNLLN